MDPIPDPNPPPHPPPQQHYTYQEVADLLRMSVSALYYQIRRGMAPSPHYFGGMARFTTAQVALMSQGTKPAGTYKPEFSSKKKGGRKGGKRAAKLRKERDSKVEDLDTKGEE